MLSDVVLSSFPALSKLVLSDNPQLGRAPTPTKGSASSSKSSSKASASSSLAIVTTPGKPSGGKSRGAVAAPSSRLPAALPASCRYLTLLQLHNCGLAGPLPPSLLSGLPLLQVSGCTV